MLAAEATEAGLAAASMPMFCAELSILRSFEAVVEGGGGGECTERASENGISPPGGLRMWRVGRSSRTPDTRVLLAHTCACARSLTLALLLRLRLSLQHQGKEPAREQEEWEGREVEWV